ncbi:MAG: helix-turn-helix domain-containing protein [Pseudonocardia sp.]|nr:helix-turn-helix domain-containing protein [Pseudonocardia sp.]
MDGLADRPRSGRPRTFSALQTASVTAIACTRPAETGIPLSRRSSTELATEAVTCGAVASISPSTVHRRLDRDPVKPRQHRSWISLVTATSRPEPPACSTSRPHLERSLARRGRLCGQRR